ncbi:SGNH/GDSL hydrolase family protein [Thalassolituus sp. ST750PaO-4]|uniref:SGNH/GDSL hydrolase family protein n=1 Tax=Thalassolituus sp. ST750PaO-4 TaxID=2742965 RepID=UPI001CE2C4B8|nr:SGNH/GDSL hydrolase family protein [Thalassolituus sp. ST750PaO-4]MCA6060843.1 SGNH/GDSL hydrolase family protein [Thalassolituus sp. ST750PaO-4]
MTSRLTLLLSYLLYLPLLPVLPWIIYQGKTVKRNTLRLPEASGIRSGTEPKLQQPAHSLLLRHIGESTVAGVGISSISNGLTACIARALASEQLAVQWQAIAQSGIRAAQLKDIIAEEDKAPEQAPYQKALLLITLGVNDTTGLTAAHQWRRQLRRIIQHETAHLPAGTQVVFTQVPPMQDFPALPAPLNRFLGLRAWQLDKQIRHLCSKQGWHHAAISLPLQPQWMAEDGYHPNAEGYARWGEGVADNIRTLL